MPSLTASTVPGELTTGTWLNRGRYSSGQFSTWVEGEVVRRRATALRRGAVLAALLMAGAALAPARAEAAGVTTHGWMAVEAIDRVGDPDLKLVLQANEHQVRAGAMFPDAGYIGSNTYGEEAHWQRFVDQYVELIRERSDCGELTDPNGPCADMIAHVMGVAAHGMGDEVWDWLFEPNGPDLGEYYTNGLPLANEGGAETQMDLVAIAIYGVPRPTIPPLPDIATLLTAFERSGFQGVTASQFDLAGLGEAVWDAESLWADQHLAALMVAMPWMSANMVTAPGGVDFAAQAIAGYWSSIWGRLNGAQPVTEVSVTYPAAGETDIPVTGWDRATFEPGSHRGRGGARNRIAAVLTHSRPYRPASVGAYPSVQMPVGTMTITDMGSGDPVAIKAGYPRSVPYGGEAGHHIIDVQPASNLEPCRTYEVEVGVTTPVLDARGEAVTPHSWTFDTECDQTSIVGTVTTPTSDPVADAYVLAYRPSDGLAPTAWTTTDADGNYELADLPDGEYSLVFWPVSGLGVGPVWSGGSSTRQAATTFTVPGEGLRSDAQLGAASTLGGRAIDASAEGAAGVEVWAFGPADTWMASAIVVTDAAGNYEFSDLPRSTYRIGFRRPGRSFSWFDQPVTVGADPVTGIDLQLP